MTTDLSTHKLPVHYAVMNEVQHVFDRAAVRRNRERAARSAAGHDFLFHEAAERLADRLDDVQRRFPLALDVGSHGGVLADVLAGRGGIETLVETDLASAWIKRAGPNRPRLAVAADEEWLPFAGGHFDLILSCLDLHWVNDLPGALIQLRRALKPDGLLLVSLLGGDTLSELREVLLQAEAEESGGASPRVSPFTDVRDLGGLAQRAGFALPVVDCDTLTVRYGNALALMRDLRLMGEANAVAERSRHFTRRNVLLRAAALYEQRHAVEGRIPATFQILTLTAWAPHESQQRPVKPGSATARLADVLGTTETSVGGRADPRSRTR